MRSLAVVAVLVLGSFAIGCAEPDLDIDEVEAPADDGGKADADSELKVRVGDTSVWMTKALDRRGTGTGASFAMRGHASRNITHGFAFIPDDQFGDFASRSARAFEVTWSVSYARTLIQGVNQFVTLDFAPSSGRPDRLVTRVIVRPRLESIAGSSKVYLTAELTPVSVGGLVAYRIKVRTTGTVTAVSARAGAVGVSGTRTVDATHAEIDLTPDNVLALAGVSGAAGQLTITATVNGATVTKQARLGLAVKKLGASTGDAYEVWPSPGCDDATRACVAALPIGADLGACGEYLEVRACPATGAIVDEAAFQAALAEGLARVGTAAFRSDAAGLVGADRVEQLQGGAEQTIEARLEPLFGQRFATVAVRTAALTAAVDGAIDAIYARPLDVVEPHAPVPGNLAALRQVAADALLAELATFDFAGSAYARPLEDLTRSFRDRHVASIRAFRESATLDGALFIGNWLDPHVEITMDLATGTATHVLIEID